MTLVVLAAGMGSRYGGMKQVDTFSDDGTFIVDYSIYDAVKFGFDKVVFIIKEENLELFKNSVEKRINGKIKVDYAFQSVLDVPVGKKPVEGREKPFGTTHAIRSIRNVVNEPFAVINSDDFYGRESFKLLANFLKDAKDSNNEYFMAGYLLKNTLSDHGSVNRGVCSINKDGCLDKIVETVNIFKGKDSAYYDDNGENKNLSFDTIVSMNCWAFTPDYIKYCDEIFSKFYDEMSNPLKDECYIANVLEYLIETGKKKIKVENSDATWLGVTYPQDKQYVVDGIKEMKNKGIYPQKLWD